MCKIRLSAYFLLQETNLYAQYDCLEMYTRDLEDICPQSLWVKGQFTCDSGHLFHMHKWLSNWKRFNKKQHVLI